MTRTGVLFLLAITTVASCDKAPPAGGAEQASAAAPSDSADRKIVFYRSSMDPSFISPKPGKDTMGMALVPVYEGDPAANLDAITVDGATVQRMGVRITPVRRGKLERFVRALGRVDLDESRISTVNMKFDGWIEKLWVNETGQFVKKGTPLLSVYSRELVASQEELLQITKSTAGGPHAEHLSEAARRRLGQFDISKRFIKGIEKRGKSSRTITLSAPRSGYVIHKRALEGTFAQMGENLFTIADLNALWVIANVYEFDAPWVYVGQDATIEFDYLPGKVQSAKVDYVYPTLDPKTRTIEVRLVLPNPNVQLKPGMFATVRIHTTPSEKTLLVPLEAVIRSGERNIAFVMTGPGRFEGREVKLGIQGEEDYEILSGLKEGEKVVVSGQFLLDSESRLKEAVKKMLGSNVNAMPTDMKSMGDAGADAGADGASPKASADAGKTH